MSPGSTKCVKTMHYHTQQKRVIFFLRRHDILNHRTDLYKTDIFRKFMIRYRQQSPVFITSFPHKNFMYFPWPPLEAALSISTLCFLFSPAYDSLISERNSQASSISKYNFHCFLRLGCCNFCWLNILLFMLANYSHG